MNEVLFALKGYSCFSANLNKGRGVLLYLKNSIPAVDVQQNRNFEESTWCRINLSCGDNIIIGCVYRSPNSTRENNLISLTQYEIYLAETHHTCLFLGILILNVLTGTT